MDNRPIGIFDSGLGGLSAVRAMHRIMPNEDIIYFGDTGRVPYGNRSNEKIAQYAQQDINFLQSFGVKYILAACGTVSSVVDFLGTDNNDVPTFGVIGPTVTAAIKASKNLKIGVIATMATIKSQAFTKAIVSRKSTAEVSGVACPMFVPLVESGYTAKDCRVSRIFAEEYLLPLAEQRIDTLILGCTHYPLLIPIIKQVIGDEVMIIDSAEQSVQFAAEYLQINNIQNGTGGDTEYYVSDIPQQFKEIAYNFMGYHIDVKQVKAL